jgi:hypothetical protein
MATSEGRDAALQHADEHFRSVGCAAHFSNRSLSGCYGGIGTGYFNAGATPPENAAVFLLSFDGNGHFKGAYIGCYNSNLTTRAFAGTYVVQPFGTGTMRWQYDPPDGGGEVLDFVLVDGGKEIAALNTGWIPAAPVVATFTFKKQ